MKLTITIDPGAQPELMKLYEEANRILVANDRPQWEFESFCTVCLSLGAIPHMIGNARALISSAKKKYNIETE